MNSPRIHPHFLFALGLLCAAVFMRLVPHPPNFGPVAAVGLFGGAVFSSRWLALILPLGVMLLSDGLLHAGYLIGWREYSGFHQSMMSVYACMMVCVLLGMLTLRTQKTAFRVVGCSLVGSCLFFVVTNFQYWLITPEPLSLTQCYVRAIPFFHYTIGGDLFYSALLFGSYALVQQKVPSLVRAA